MKEIAITPYLETLLVQDIERKNKATYDLEMHLRIVFESNGLEMPTGGNLQVKDGKIFYTDNKK